MSESIPDTSLNEAAQKKVLLGSKAMFEDLRADMQCGRDMLVLIHGYNVSWEEAVGTAAALEATMNRPDPAPRGAGDDSVASTQAVRVVLFTWPSNGQALPFVSYKSDRGEAAGSSGAVGRGLLKVRDFLHELGREVRGGNRQVARLRSQLEAQGVRPSEIDRAVAQFEATEVCGRSLHLLAHSMGNFVLQHALNRLWEFSPGTTLPRLFDRVFLCAADVDDDVLEAGQADGAGAPGGQPGGDLSQPQRQRAARVGLHQGQPRPAGPARCGTAAGAAPEDDAGGLQRAGQPA